MKAALPQSKEEILTSTKTRILMISRWISQLGVVFKQHLLFFLCKHLNYKGFLLIIQILGNIYEWTVSNILPKKVVNKYAVSTLKLE